jgi:hypothetical protein
VGGARLSCESGNANGLTIALLRSSQFCDVHVQRRRSHGAAAVSRFTVEQSDVVRRPTGADVRASAHAEWTLGRQWLAMSEHDVESPTSQRVGERQIRVEAGKMPAIEGRPSPLALLKVRPATTVPAL